MFILFGELSECNVICSWLECHFALMHLCTFCYDNVASKFVLKCNVRVNCLTGPVITHCSLVARTFEGKSKMFIAQYPRGAHPPLGTEIT